jgi:uncharacterized membrane protein YbhN (UPF0104 family)
MNRNDIVFDDRTLPESTEAPMSSPLPMTSRRRPRAAILFSTVIFAGCALYIGFTFQWGEIAKTLREVNLTCLIGGGGLSIMIYWLIRTLRWRLLLRQTGVEVPFFDLYMCTAVSLSFAIFTPMQSGEMLKVELLNRYGMVRRSPGYGAFLVERALDLATVLAMACIGLIITSGIPISKGYVFFFCAALASAGAAGVFVLRRLKFRGKVLHLVENILNCVRDVSNLGLVVLITCVSWASVTFSWQIFLYSGALPLTFAKTMALMSIVALISILSLIPGGLGISEAGTAQVLIWFGFCTSAAQAGSLVLRSYSLIAIFLGAGHMLLWRLARRRRNPAPSKIEPGIQQE